MSSAARANESPIDTQTTLAFFRSAGQEQTFAPASKIYS